MTANFPNGTALDASALAPDAIEILFKPLVAQILGLDISNPPVAYYAVRSGWQQQGQPAWKITEDVCIITANPLNTDYGRVRDRIVAANDDTTVALNMSYTQVWSMHFTLYGPNAYANARLIVSAMSLDWVEAYLANPPQSVSQLYTLAAPSRPEYVPELKDGQWWKRVDVNLKLNELVFETTTVPSAVSATVQILTDTGASSTFSIPPSQ